MLLLVIDVKQFLNYPPFSMHFTGRVTIATNNKIMNEKNDWIVITTSITYSWSFVTQIFRSDLPSHGGDSTTLIYLIEGYYW
jgi:hypothetical protein